MNDIKSKMQELKLIFYKFNILENRILPTDAKDAFDILIKTKKFINNLYKDFGFCF